ncbi:MAG TPA: hypothetical protein VGO56_08725 [Pyrinomonadaceae bacterium]|jgi:hypothetical protein|nr:hypothetical protein [Pyrinomonadaceae bacterium]
MSVDLIDAKSLDFPVSIFDAVGMVEKSAMSRRLQQPIADISTKLNVQMDDLVVTAINAPTVEDFRAIRDRAFKSYMRLIVAISNTIRAKMDDIDLPILIEESFEALEADVPVKAAAYFGDEIAQEIGFSLSTLKSAYRWLPHLASVDVSPERANEDRELSHKFFVATAWAQFHLDGLRVALSEKYDLLPEVVRELLAGVRQSVMAYAYVREALDLRELLESRYADPPQLSWSADDEALANAD